MTARLRAALPALHHRDFALLFGGQAISVVGDALFPVALAFAVLELSGSPSSLGLVLAAQALPLALFALVGGVVGDRVSRQRLMLAVHHEGHAVVAEGAREQMELHARAMHDYGLWATVREAPE